MKVTFFGTTTLLLDDGRDQVFFDAHFTRPSLLHYLFGSGETNKAMVDELMRLHGVDRLRAIFISHSHHDHVMDMPYLANCSGAAVYGSPSALNVARGGDVPESSLHAFRGGERFDVGGYSVDVLPSLHSKPTILNNDLGKTIDAPLRQPARLRDYREGGSFDFYVRAGKKRVLVRPSFNYIEGQLDGLHADTLFLGVAGMARADAATRAKFFAETVEKVQPKLVIPIHWDNFFVPLDRPARGMPKVFERTEVCLDHLARYCAAQGVNCVVQLPGTSMEI